MFPRSRSRSPHDPGYAHRYQHTDNHIPLSVLPDHRTQSLDPQPSIYIRMSPDLLPPPTSQPLLHVRPLRRVRSFIRANGRLKTTILFGAFISTCLFLYTTLSSSPTGRTWRRPFDWDSRPHFSPEHSNLSDTPHLPPSTSPDTPDTSTDASRTSPLQGLVPEALSLEQIRDIVASTRGFFSRDYSLGLGWNNMRYIIDAAVLQAELLNRTLVLPSFVYARACEYPIDVCADFSTMVNKGDAIGWEEWRNLPIEQQMGFRIPISVMIDLPRLRSRHRVITASEYLRLHGQDPASESSSGYWIRDWYISQPNVFDPDNRMPTQFVIENHWYDPGDVNRVDYIPQAMKNRGRWERYIKPESQEAAGFWPPEESTDVSNRLRNALPDGKFIMSWDTAKAALRAAGPSGDMNDDGVVEGILNDNGWEVLRTFHSVLGMEYAKTVVEPINEVAPRSTIRGFKDDYYDIDADVVVLAGETHLYRKPGAMRFTENSSRMRFTNMVVHSIVFPPKILALADVLATRMRELNGGRQWMGAHMRRGDFLRTGWAMESTPEAHVNRVKNRLQTGRMVLEQLKDLSTYDIEGAKPDMEQITVPPPLPDDFFYVATDERDPDAMKVISNAGAIMLSDLLTMDDRRMFGWPLMITDVRALVEQALLMHSAFFYGHGMSSLAGVITNLRAARGADPRTMLLD